MSEVIVSEVIRSVGSDIVSDYQTHLRLYFLMSMPQKA